MVQHMPFYSLKEIAAYAKRKRLEAGDSLADAADKISELRGDDSVHRANVHKAEGAADNGPSKYSSVLRDEIRVYDPDADFDLDEPHYEVGKDISR